jgi:cytochrome bd-type quinol oxidase subunit 2
MTDASTVVPLAPFVDTLQPYLTAAATTIIGAAVLYGAALFQRWTGIKIDQANEAALAKAVSTQAGLAIAASATNLAGQSIDAHSSAVASGANYIATNLKPLLAATGRSPDDVAHDIAGAIGLAQAATPTVVATLPEPAIGAVLK